MAVKPGKIVRVEVKSGIYALRNKLFIHNLKAIRVRGIVRRDGA